MQEREGLKVGRVCGRFMTLKVGPTCRRIPEWVLFSALFFDRLKIERESTRIHIDPGWRYNRPIQAKVTAGIFILKFSNF